MIKRKHENLLNLLANDRSCLFVRYQKQKFLSREKRSPLSFNNLGFKRGLAPPPAPPGVPSIFIAHPKADIPFDGITLGTLITIFTNDLHKMSGEDEDYQFYRRCGITRRIVKGLQ